MKSKIKMKSEMKMKTSLGIPKKVLKFLPFLIISMVVTGASAAIYNMMYMESTGIGVEAPKVYFIRGSDSGAGVTVTIGPNGTYVNISNLKGWPNAPRVYENVTAIHNADTSSRTINLAFDSWSGDTSYVTITVKVYDSAGTQKGTVTLGTPGSNTGDISIPAGQNFRVQWEIRWSAGALSSYSVSAALILRVNE